MRVARALVARVARTFLAFACAVAPASAARPLLDQHQWDAYFGLYARDASVPWKRATVRLDTYSGAPVDFAAYNVDPADVIVAGQERAARPLDTTHRTPLVRWRFSPPRGYRFESSDVPVPLGSQEGFYVVEARRGDAVQQVWLNRSHVGLVARERAGALVLWGVDLRSGRAIPRMRVEALVGTSLIERTTDNDGLLVWSGATAPSFALAESGAGRAFVSILPQAPPAQAIVGLRLDSAVARAGERVRFVGFARMRGGGAYRRATGDVRVSLAGRGATLASTVLHLDPAGAFSGELAIPAGADGGDDAVLASVAGGVGGTTLHVDAAGDSRLSIVPACPCEAGRDVALVVAATRGDAPAAGLPVHLVVVRVPHVVPPGASEDAPRWGTTVVYDRTLSTDATGRAHATLEAPSDGLDSTYGVRATTRGASATTRVVMPQSAVSLALEPLAAVADVGAPVAFALRAFSASDGAVVAGLGVHVELSHGASVAAQDVVLDARGRGTVVFRRPSLGSNLAIASATATGGRALDAAAVTVEPSALTGRTLSAAPAVTIATDRTTYAPGGRVAIRATATGADGDAMLAMGDAVRRVSVSRGAATTTLSLGGARGAVRIDAAFVRDGAIALGDAPVAVVSPGHALATTLSLDRETYAPGDVVHATIRDAVGASPATLATRIADGRESGPAYFDDAPGLLDASATNAQAPASDDPAWHAYVAPARSKANDIFAAERPRRTAADPPTLGAASPRTSYWRVARATGDAVDVPAPAERGHFVVSVLRVADDGDVGAASASFDVR